MRTRFGSLKPRNSSARASVVTLSMIIQAYERKRKDAKSNRHGKTSQVLGHYRILWSAPVFTSNPPEHPHPVLSWSSSPWLRGLLVRSGFPNRRKGILIWNPVTNPQLRKNLDHESEVHWRTAP